MAQVCQVCEEKKDLRYGTCCSCADFVKSDGLTAWDIRNPSKRWTVWREPKRVMVVKLCGHGS
jgi:hypothetical protein